VIGTTYSRSSGLWIKPCSLFQLRSTPKTVIGIDSTPWKGEWPTARPLATEDSTNVKKMCTYIHVPSGLFKPTVSVWEKSVCLKPTAWPLWFASVVFYLLMASNWRDKMEKKKCTFLDNFFFAFFSLFCCKWNNFKFLCGRNKKEAGESSGGTLRENCTCH
jgi:hypothetical protein